MNLIETAGSPQTAVVGERDRDMLRELIALMIQTDVVELVVEHAPAKVAIKRWPLDAGQAVDRARLPAPEPAAAAPPAPQPPPALAGPAAPAAVQPPQPDSADPGHRAAAPGQLPEGQLVTAPMVGTFYAAPSPKDQPLAREGDSVKVGDRIGVIEAMKILNEVECDVAGRVAQVLVQNGQPVEYGQPLMLIAPA